MILVLLSTICLLILFNIITSKAYGKGFSIIKVFNYTWIATALVYILNPLGYDKIGSTTALYVFLLVLTVNVGFLIFRKRYVVEEPETEIIAEELQYSPQKIKALTILSILSWAVSVGRIKSSLQIILSQGMASLRTYVYWGDIYTTIEKLAYQYFVQPLFVITIIVAAEILVFSRGKKYKYIFLVAIIDALVYSLLFGGRALLLLILLYIVFSLLIKNKGNIIRMINEQKRIILFLIVLAAIIGAYSMMRVTRNWGIISEFLVYTTGGLGFFSKIYENGSLMPGVLNGFGIIGCVHDFVGLLLKFLGVNITLVSQTYSQYVTDFLSIGSGIKTNFTATALGTFYLDGGIIGIFLGGIAYSLLFAIAENKYCNNKSIYTLSFYIYASNIAFESIQNYTPKSVVFLFVIFYMWILLKDKRYKITFGNR